MLCRVGFDVQGAVTLERGLVPKLSLEVVVPGEVWEWKRLWRVDLEE